MARSLRRFEPLPRLRPGEAPVWVDLGLSTAEGRAWRDRARAMRLGVDAWLAVLLEFDLARFAASRYGAAVGDADASDGGADGVTWLAPTESLRRWVQLLDGGIAAGELPTDELPLVVLPERLVNQVPGRDLPAAARRAVGGVDPALALSWELSAARRGLTLERWLLQRVLGDASAG